MTDLNSDNSFQLGEFEFAPVVTVNMDGVSNRFGIRMNESWYILSVENAEIFAQALIDRLGEIEGFVD